MDAFKNLFSIILEFLKKLLTLVGEDVSILDKIFPPEADEETDTEATA